MIEAKDKQLLLKNSCSSYFIPIVDVERLIELSDKLTCDGLYGVLN